MVDALANNVFLAGSDLDNSLVHYEALGFEALGFEALGFEALGFEALGFTLWPRGPSTAALR